MQLQTWLAKQIDAAAGVIADMEAARVVTRNNVITKSSCDLAVVMITSSSSLGCFYPVRTRFSTCRYSKKPSTSLDSSR